VPLQDKGFRSEVQWGLLLQQVLAVDTLGFKKLSVVDLEQVEVGTLGVVVGLRETLFHFLQLLLEGGVVHRLVDLRLERISYLLKLLFLVEEVYQVQDLVFLLERQVL